MISKQKFEDVLRVYEEAKRAYDARRREWLAAQKPRPVTNADFEALDQRYIIEHPEEVGALEALVTEVNVARAELERRWVEAHEDLGVLRRAAEGLGVLPDRAGS